MNTSLKWLEDFLPGAALDPSACAEALTGGGLPVEHIQRLEKDAVLDVEVTSNRSDCLSHIGVAREISALLDRPFKDVQIVVDESTTPVSDLTSVRIDAPELCPHYTARVIRNVKIGPSPDWMIKRLEAIGVRSINNVVDVTNYVMFELGQPLHAFDFDKLSGRKIIVRTARDGESITSIDGHERKLSEGMLVIADAEKPVALAGVMGGLDSEVTNRTVNVLLESARFDPLSVRRTARALDMKSDSSYRFERGIDPLLPERASLRAGQLILQTAGGELASGQAEAGAPGFSPQRIVLRLERMRKLLGTEIEPGEAVESLRRLLLNPVLDGETITIEVPSWRQDLSIEADVIEEVARIVGYDRIPVRHTISIVLTPPAPEARVMDQIRTELTSAGYFEAVTFTFVSDLLAGDFVPEGVASLPRADARVRKSDAHLRPSILPGLLEAVRRNETRGTSGAKLFETGSTFGVESAGKVIETRRLGLVGDQDLHALRGAVESLLMRLDGSRAVRIVPDRRAGFETGASGRIEWGDQPIGFIGRIDKKVAEKLSLRAIPAAAELELAPLLSGAQPVPQYRPLPKYPPVRRDLSLIVSDNTPYDALDALIRSLDLPDLEETQYVTTYRGKPLARGQKSLTTTLVFRSEEGTLTSEQVEPQVARVVEVARKQLHAELRT
jgi:phenylalanyl-tRNA synthetase beta chain